MSRLILLMIILGLPVLSSVCHAKNSSIDKEPLAIVPIVSLLLDDIDSSNLLDWNWRDFSRPLDQSYASDGARKLADRIIQFQRPSGGWSKRYDYDPEQPYDAEQLSQLLARNLQEAETFDEEDVHYTLHSHSASTFDNDATTNEIRFLLRVAHITRDVVYIEAAQRGIAYVLKAQYDIGGWPQNYPNLGSYGGYITFNDNVMSNISYCWKS